MAGLDAFQSYANTEQTAPSYYTNYLTTLANNGTQAATGAQYVGASDLQKQAFADASNNVGNYQPILSDAGTALSQAMVDPSARAKQYMNPYTDSVVKSIGDLGERNIQQNLDPSAVAGAVSSGQFGSKRGAEVQAQTDRDARTNILAQQSNALQSGYQNALQAGLQQNQTNLGVGQAGTNLATATQNLGIGDVNTQATLGQQQQTIAQNGQLFPLQTLSDLSKLLQGQTIPMDTKQTMTPSGLGVASGAVTGLLSLTRGTGVNGTGPSSLDSLLNSAKSVFGDGSKSNNDPVDMTGFQTPYSQPSYGGPTPGSPGTPPSIGTNNFGVPNNYGFTDPLEFGKQFSGYPSGGNQTPVDANGNPVGNNGWGEA